MKRKNVKKELEKGEIIIYEDKKGHAKLEVNLKDETLWLSQKQVAELFNIDRTVVTKHIRNVFKDKELDKKSVCAKFAHTAEDGKIYNVDFYSLDMILSVGYRVNSKRATQFRIWATQTLKKYITDGYIINAKRLEEKSYKNLAELQSAIGLLQNAMKSKKLELNEAEGLLQVISEYANSWVLLQQYDEGKLEIKKKKSRKSKMLSYEDAAVSINKLKSSLIKSKEATDLFGRERGDGLKAIIGNINQTFSGKELYPSIEEKAAHLFYFVIKDHPLTDGNKRSAALLFILFLQRNGFLLNKKGEKKINDNALVALALLIAQSNPKEKNVMIALITNLLQG